MKVFFLVFFFFVSIRFIGAEELFVIHPSQLSDDLNKEWKLIDSSGRILEKRRMFYVMIEKSATPKIRMLVDVERDISSFFVDGKEIPRDDSSSFIWGGGSSEIWYVFTRKNKITLYFKNSNSLDIELKGVPLNVSVIKDKLFVEAFDEDEGDSLLQYNFAGKLQGKIKAKGVDASFRAYGNYLCFFEENEKNEKITLFMYDTKENVFLESKKNLYAYNERDDLYVIKDSDGKYSLYKNSLVTDAIATVDAVFVFGFLDEFVYTMRDRNYRWSGKELEEIDYENENTVFRNSFYEIIERKDKQKNIVKFHNGIIVESEIFKYNRWDDIPLSDECLVIRERVKDDIVSIIYNSNGDIVGKGKGYHLKFQNPVQSYINNVSVIVIKDYVTDDWLYFLLKGGKIKPLLFTGVITRDGALDLGK